MSFDISRFTFDPFKDYWGVVQEQGRVQLDSDWNEWLAEVSRRIQAGTFDIMGHASYPATTPYAFQIFASNSGGTNTVEIGLGRMYVDGLMVENHGDFETPPWDTSLAELSGSPQPPPGSPVKIDFGSQPYNPGASVPQVSGEYLAYLDVWMRPVTYLEDPSLVDAAVGVDTTGRLQTVWQVNLKPVPSGSNWNCSTPDSELGFPVSSGQLTNNGNGPVPSGPSGSCCLTTGAGYTGVENQFYRVEIHDPGTIGGANATFKWSRENASVLTGVTGITNGANSLDTAASILTVMNLGRDQVLGFNPGNWIEITNDTMELQGLSGELYQIDSVDYSSKTITLTMMLSGNFPATSLTTAKNTRICRWDQSGKIYRSDNTLYDDLDEVSGGSPKGCKGIRVPPDGTTLLLENGITIQFGLSPASGNYLAMDHWNFAARTANGTIDPLTSAPPRGLHHHYTKLSIVTFGPSVSFPDCRTKWPPSGATESGCCTNTVGDGILSFGMYTSIQAAINALPSKGGEVCILPGQYYEHVLLNNLNNVVIKGCGAQTHVYSPSLQSGVNAAQSGNAQAASELAAVFTVVGSQFIELRSFVVHAADDEVGILLDRASSSTNQSAGGQATAMHYLTMGNQDVEIGEISIDASTLPAILAVSVDRLRIAENRITMKEVQSLWAAVYLSGNDMVFERNSVGIYSKVTASTDMYLAKAPSAPGGIQIAGPSNNVFLIENEISGGCRNGITLGNFIILDANGADTGTLTGILVETEGACSAGGSNQITVTTTGPNPRGIGTGGVISNLHINRNSIHDMGMCGIGPVGFFDLAKELEIISLVNVSIDANVITRTLQREVINATGNGYGAICIPDVVNLSIRDNDITDFGAVPGAEVCGIFVLHGEQIEISRNQIKETRDWSAPPATAANNYGGMRAGILVYLVTPPVIDGSNAGLAWVNALMLQNQTSDASKAPLYAPGLPALRIQENVVRVALGLALEAIGYGPFEISNNHFSTGGTASVKTDSMRAFEMNLKTGQSTGNSLVPVLTVGIMNLGLAIEDANPGYGYAKMYGNASSLLDYRANQASSSNGGVLFTNNVCQLEAWASGAKGFSSVAILSLDHVLFANNQLWLDGPMLTAWLDAFVLGLTIQACTNRLQESNGYPVLISGLVAGMANVATQNICTYCLIAVAPASYLVNAQNLIFQSYLCKQFL